MSCQHDCERPPGFPKRIVNRPGLPAIDYRIGGYTEMRAHMLARLDRLLALARWTHRQPDDPAIALIEGAAIVGDILSFYQQLYANEAFLRTARWRESVADLVKLLGYRLAPGLGGHARFAFAVKGDKPVRVPKGFGLKAQLDGAPKLAVFETSAPVIAYPHLGQFHLYRPRYTPAITNGTDTFYIAAPAGNAAILKAGDRVLVGIVRQDGASLDHSQVLIVEKTWESFGTLFVKTKGGMTSLRRGKSILSSASALTAIAGLGSSPASVSLPALGSSTLTVGSTLALSTTANQSFAIQLAPTPSVVDLVEVAARISAAGELRAYKLGGSFRHFGHNAPPAQTVVDANGRARSEPVSYVRSVSQSTLGAANPALASTHIPLDGEVDSVSAGTTLVVEINLSTAAQGGTRSKRLIERTVRAVDRQSLAWGPTSGASTVLTLDRSIALSEGGKHFDFADIRGITLHQVEGAAFTLKAAMRPTKAKSGTDLEFYGTAAEAAALDERMLLLAGPGSTLVEANVLAVKPGPSSAAENHMFHRVTLNRAVAYRNFDHDQPAVTIYGNLVAATEGKSEGEVTLGDGDARQIFQTFALPKPPLTYLFDPAQEPPHAAELSVRVEGRLWRRVDSLFASGPLDRVYVVREDADGKSFVQFGDGKTGARLPSGRGNVVARFRTGNGSSGPLKADAKPQPASRLSGLDKVFMLEPAAGAAAPESEASARIAAPGRMQSLARLVSLADFEAEALATAGVLKARAAWTVIEGTPHVAVTVLTQSRSPADAKAIADTLSALYSARGPARYPVTVSQGRRRQLHIGATVAYDLTYRESEVRDAILEALGVAAENVAREHGLFSWQRRQFGQAVHGSQVVAAIQNVPGAMWVRLTALRRKTSFLLSSVPLSIVQSPSVALLAEPTPSLSPPIAALSAVGLNVVPPARRVIVCPDDNILALDAANLTLSLVQAEAGEVP